MPRAPATARRSRAPAAAGDAAPDYGPPERLLRGEIERHDRPDPDAPNRTISGARRVYLYDLAWRRGSITDAEREAADRYLILSERASGASAGPDGSGVRVAPWQRAPSEAVLAAVGELRRADEALGAAAVVVLRAYVLDNMPILEIARRRGEQAQLAWGRIRAALERLVEHWRLSA